MVTEKTFKARWKKLTAEQKLDFNGYEGFKKGEKRKNTNLFMPKRLRK